MAKVSFSHCSDYLNAQELLKTKDIDRKIKNGTATDEEIKERQRLLLLDALRDEEVNEICSAGMTSQCIEKIKLVYQAKYSYAGLAEHHTPYDLFDFNPEQREQFNGLLEGYSPEFIHLVTVNKYTPEEAEAYILHRIEQERKFQEALDSMHPLARTAMEIQQIIGMVSGVKAAETYLQPLKKAPLGLGSTGRSEPKNLKEQLVLKEIMSDPTKGLEINVPMTDKR